VYRNSLATVKHQIQQAENPKQAVVISEEAARCDNTTLLKYVTSVVAHEKPEISSPDKSILIDNNCKDDELDFGIPVACGDYETD
jgi:hypothetical protein